MPIAKRIGLGSVLGYLVAGVVIGPFVLTLVGEEGQDVMHFAEFGVVMMLFLVGLELQPALLWRLRGTILGMGGLQVAATTALIAGASLALGTTWQVALAIGMILSLSSTAIVLQTLSEKGLTKTEGGQGCFSVLLFQDIAVIPMLAVLPMLAVQGAGAPPAVEAGHGGIGGLAGWQQALIVFGLIGAFVAGGKLLIVNERLVQPRFAGSGDEREAEEFQEANPVIIAGFGRFGHVVGRLLKANGVGTTVLDLDPEQIETLHHFGLKGFYGDASRLDLLHAAVAEMFHLWEAARRTWNRRGNGYRNSNE